MCKVIIPNSYTVTAIKFVTTCADTDLQEDTLITHHLTIKISKLKVTVKFLILVNALSRLHRSFALDDMKSVSSVSSV